MKNPFPCRPSVLRPVNNYNTIIIILVLFLPLFLFPLSSLFPLFFLFPLFPAPATAAEDAGDGFQPAILKYEGDWDPRPLAFPVILENLARTTSLRVLPERAVVEMEAKDLAAAPLLLWMGTSGFSPWPEHRGLLLRRYLSGGGRILVADATGAGPFEESVRREIRRALPEVRFGPVPRDHAIFRSFYLVKSPGGRFLRTTQVEGAFLGDTLVAVFLPNDLFGALERERLGGWLYECSPGGEAQRMDALKFCLNLFVFAVTDTYKEDTVHQPFIQQRLR